MSKNTIVKIGKPGTVTDELTDLLRIGASRLILEAVEAELADFLSGFTDHRDKQGRKAVVRNGYLPERKVQTGIGEVAVKVPKVRDRNKTGIKFQSSLLPPYLRRTKSIGDLLPWLYLKGVSTGDFQEALSSLLGEEAKGVSAGTISRLKTQWQEEHKAWTGRTLSKARYVYFWADGVYFNIRSEEAKQCILVIIGVTEQGHKELVAIDDGYRESTQSWMELLLDLKRRGLQEGPKLAIGDGALGFWKAMRKVYSATRHQRCWVHKTANILNKMPKSLQGKAKQNLHEIWMAETRKDANKAFDGFVESYEDKYPKSVDCLKKDRDELLAFYDFPAAHWQHIRTSNPIESTFATVRLRTAKTRGCVSRQSILSLAYKLAISAQKRWQRLRGFKQLSEVIKDVKFVDGIREDLRQDAA
jgi:putative transposase